MPKASLPHIPPLNVPHREQTQPSDCLAACAAMILAYLGCPVDYARLLTILQIGPLGAPRRNILRLTRLGVDVTYREATFSLAAPQRIPLGEFELAWLNCDNACSVVVVRRPT